jgi:hypothetical protein
MAVIMRNADSYRHRTDFEYEYEYEYDDQNHGEQDCSSERADCALVPAPAHLPARH